MNRKRDLKIEPIYFRLCHVCAHLNEADHTILTCENCNNEFSSPWIENFYKEVYRKQKLRDDEEGPVSERAGKLFPHRAITGLSVVW